MPKIVTKTALKRLNIQKFRALKDVVIDFGTHVTVICGKNGTSKSSILGIAAQIFSFDKDYSSGIALNYETITKENFKSLPSEHFRFSERFDVPGSLSVKVEIFDGYTEVDATAELELAKRYNRARPVLRKNTTASSGNRSRNFTHPVIFLSLRRLQPIAFRDYKVQDFEYLNLHKDEFIALNNELLNKQSSIATGTGGSIESAVAYGEEYDQNSVSAGEDNAGQIILALMSFRKLREDYPDYKGGLLLIDEADAGLFPAAQTKLLEILERECNELGIQVVMTSHSPTLIERTFELSKKYQRKYKTIYLSDTYGKVEARHDFSWQQIYSDLHTETIRVSAETSLPVVNTYFEDKEGADLFNALLYRSPIKRYLNQLSDISLGCSNYIQLVKKGVPEFASKSIIVLDADAIDGKHLETISLLPGALPPDQLIFEYLYNLNASHQIWKNPLQFTRSVLTSRASKIRTILSITGSTVNLKEAIDNFKKKNPDSKIKLREVFKEFYKQADVQEFLQQRGSANPWRMWISENSEACELFRTNFNKKLSRIMQDGFGVDPAKLAAIFPI